MLESFVDVFNLFIFDNGRTGGLQRHWFSELFGV